MPITEQVSLQQSSRQTGNHPSRWALPITAGAGFLAGLDTTAVNLALPDIQRALAAGLTELQWVVNAFALLSAALLVTAGDLSDRFGRRRVFVSGLLAFAGASAACSPTSSDGGRCSSRTYPWPRSSPSPRAPASPSFAAAPVTRDGRGSTTPASRRPHSGSARCCTPRSGATPGGRRSRCRLPPSWGSRASRRSSQSSVAPSTVVDLHLFRSRTFTGAVVATAVGGAAYFGMLVYLSLFLQETQKYNAVEAGLVYLPTILPFMIISPFAGRLLARMPGAPLPTIGLGLIACGILVLVGVDEGAGLLDVAVGMAVAGLGTGLAVTPLTQLALDQVPTERSGMASGVLQTSRPVGVTIGVTILGLAVPGEMDVAAFRAVAVVAAGLAALAAVIAAMTIRPAADRSREP